MAGWTFLSTHARVLACVASQEAPRLREIADCIGVTERSAYRVVDELVEAGYLSRHRLGNRSFYEVHPELPLRDDDLSWRIGDRGHPTVGDLLAPVVKGVEKARS